MKTTIAVTVALAASILLAGCTVTASRPPASTAPPHQLARGYSTNRSEKAPVTKSLNMLPTTDITSSAGLRQGPIDASNERSTVEQLTGETMPVQVRHLAVGGEFRSGSHLVVVAEVNGGKPHDVDFILAGPNGQRWEHLVKVSTNAPLAAGTIILPKVASGNWVLGVEDESGIADDASGHLTGDVVLGLATFTVR